MKIRARATRRIPLDILRYGYFMALAAWLAIFGSIVSGIAWRVEALAGIAQKLEANSRFLNEGASMLAQLVREIQEQSQELALLHSLPNILPQDKGYLRTQKVIAEDVQSLRLKVGRRLQGMLHIVVDTKANKLYLKRGLALLWQADCSVGRGGILKDKKTGRVWEFVTPRGEFKVLGKKENPIWRKPDWAFVELGEPIPPPDDPRREVPGELGRYVLNLGDGYLIHGTKREELLGRAVSHGCVRLGAEDLEKLYQGVPVGTRVYIF
jgi:L,D-transpeptidase YbiS